MSLYVYTSARMYVPLTMCVRAPRSQVSSLHIWSAFPSLLRGCVRGVWGQGPDRQLALLPSSASRQTLPSPFYWYLRKLYFYFTLLCFFLFFDFYDFMCISLLNCHCHNNHNTALTLIETLSYERGLQKNKCALLLNCCYITVIIYNGYKCTFTYSLYTLFLLCDLLLHNIIF